MALFTKDEEFPWEQKAKDELNDDPDLRAERLAEFRSRILELIKPRGSKFKPALQDDFLLAVLRTRKFDLNSALKCYDKFTSLRCINPKIFMPLAKGPKDYLTIYERCILKILPDRNPLDGTLVILWNWSAWTPGLCELTGIVAATFFLLMDILRNSPSVQTYGVRFIFHLGGFTLSYLKYTPFSYVKGLCITLQGGSPARYKGLHVVHYPAVTKIAFHLVKPFARQKMLDRLHFHSNLEELHEHIDPNILPEELGGTKGKLEMGAPEKYAISKHDEYVEINSLGWQIE